MIIIKSETSKHIKTYAIPPFEWISSYKESRKTENRYKTYLARTDISRIIVPSVGFHTDVFDEHTGAPCVCLRWRLERRTRGPNKHPTYASTTTREVQTVLFTPQIHQIHKWAPWKAGNPPCRWFTRPCRRCITTRTQPARNAPRSGLGSCRDRCVHERSGAGLLRHGTLYFLGNLCDVQCVK